MAKKHIFIDWNGVEAGYGFLAPGYEPQNASPYGVRILAEKPELDPVPALSADKPWEDRCLNDYTSVMKVGDTYRMYYECFGREAHEDCSYRLCLALSSDGVHWEKPSLGICVYDGSTDNNILVNCIGLRTYGYTVIYEEDAPPAERFKMVHTQHNYREDGSLQVVTVYETSEDGLHFTPQRTLFEGGDAPASLFRDPNTGKYVVYSKTRDPRYLARRTMMRCEGEAFDKMTAPEIVLYNDPADPPDIDYYTSSCHPFPGAEDAYIMLPACYHRTSDLVDIRLYTSRDGRMWYRPMGEGAWVENTRQNKSCYAGIGILEGSDGTWSMFVGSSDHGHNDYNGECVHIYRAVLREDGFLCLYAPSYGGFVTETLTSDSTALVWNAETEPNGCIRAEIVDAKTCEPFPGFSFADCTAKKTDSVHTRVQWKEPLSALSGKPFRIRFKLFKARLYSYTI